jgi:hypothetical protein
MKHPHTNCDCGQAVAPLALRWRCAVCGKTSIMKVSTLSAVCDGDRIRKVEPEVLQDRSRSLTHYIRRYLRSASLGSGGLVSTICVCGFPFIASIFFNRRSSSVAKSCSFTFAVTANLGWVKGRSSIAALILTDNGNFASIYTAFRKVSGSISFICLLAPVLRFRPKIF